MSIKQEMLKGLMWSAIEKYSGILISLIVTAILARLISPEDFGIISVATVIINFLNIFTTMGIFPAIIQRKDLSEKDLDSIFTFSIICGIILSSIFFFSSYFIADFYKNDTIKSICQLLSINLFFLSVNLVPSALMARNKKFKNIAQRTLTLQIISGVISVTAAYNGMEVYALTISPITTAIGMFCFNLYYYPRHIDWNLNIKPLKKIFSYSIFQFLFELINYFSRNLDKLIIGKCLNMRDLGYYDKSYRLMMLPLQNVTSVITPVMQPVLSSLQDNKADMAAKYNRIIQLIATISFPIAVFIYFSAFEIINIVYGNNWNQAIPTFQILSLSLPLQMILSTSGSIFQASNATKSLFLVGLQTTTITITGFILATIIYGTINAIAWSWVITQIFCFIISYVILYRKVLKSSILRMLTTLKYPFINSLILSIVLYISIDWNIDNIFISLFIKLSISIIITIITLLLFKQYKLFIPQK